MDDNTVPTRFTVGGQLTCSLTLILPLNDKLDVIPQSNDLASWSPPRQLRHVIREPLSHCLGRYRRIEYPAHQHAHVGACDLINGRVQTPDRMSGDEDAPTLLEATSGFGVTRLNSSLFFHFTASVFIFLGPVGFPP